MRNGILQGMNPFTLYWSGKIPASVFLSSYPGDPDQPHQWDTLFYALGMVAEVFQKFGVSTVSLPGDDVVLWFGVLYLVNMQMSFLSPPFGYALFYIKGVCPPEITMATIFKSALAFLAMQAIALMLCIMLPGLVTWLPNLVYG